MRITLKRILIWLVRALDSFGINLSMLNPDKDNFLRVLLFHDVAPDELNSFRDKIDYLDKHFNFVTPSEFEAMMDGSKPIIGKNLLLTFDDGFKSNRVIATNILDHKNIKAIFFIVSDFAELNKIEDSREFIGENIYPAKHPSDIPSHWENMDWEDLKYLVDNDHVIGCHTKTHARLSLVSDSSDLMTEMLESAKILEKELNINVDHFAYPFGDLNSFSAAALNIAKSKFKHIHSGLRGRNRLDDFEFLVLRDSVAGGTSVQEVLFYLNGWVDGLYVLDRRKFRTWEASSCQR